MKIPVPGGSQLREQRRKQNVTLKQLGKAVGRTEAWVSLVEHGKRRPLSSDVQKLEHFLNCHLDELEVRGGQS